MLYNAFHSTIQRQPIHVQRFVTISYRPHDETRRVFWAMFQLIWVRHVLDRRLVALNPKPHRSKPHLVDSKVHVQCQFCFHRHSENIFEKNLHWNECCFTLHDSRQFVDVYICVQSAELLQHFRYILLMCIEIKHFLFYWILVAYVILWIENIVSVHETNYIIGATSIFFAVWLKFAIFIRIKAKSIHLIKVHSK